jgi:hypothetical protein
MYSNQLSGELPGTNFATKLTKLTDLVLNNNLLTGPLPSSFGAFASVKSMYARPSCGHPSCLEPATRRRHRACNPPTCTAPAFAGC